MSIRPDNLTLDKLLQGRLFRIPDYQRAYSWETKQREDLFGDIKKLAQSTKNERHHFMSTVVCLQTNQKEEVGADEFGVFHVVDGQQRLTTLIILLKALAKALSMGNDTERKESFKLNELLVKENDGRLILLQTNHDSQLLFRQYLEKGIISDEENVETMADRNMIRAFQECEEFVRTWHSDPLSLLKVVKNRLDFIFYVLEDEGAVHTTFEVLNSRGLEVDWLDKCKSILMGIAFEKLNSDASSECIQELHRCWTKIYRTIGLKKISGQEVLRFAGTLEHLLPQSKINSAENAMEFFRKKCKKDPKSVTEVSSKFLKIAEQLERLGTNARLNAVTKISQARLLAVAVMLHESLDKSEKQNILKQWEKITFRIFGMSRKDSRTKVGEYVRLSGKIYKTTTMTATEITNEIAFLGKDYPAGEAAKEMRDKNCYEGWESELIYFLYRYEEHLARKYGGSISEEVWEQVWHTSPTKTIEHIHPQTPNESWRGKFGTKKDFVERQSQRLGNLMLLPPGVNSMASNKSFEQKKEIYKKHRNLKLIDEVIEKADWDSETLKEREERLIAWAEKEWE
jgi:hypothetical protein